MIEVVWTEPALAHLRAHPSLHRAIQSESGARCGGQPQGSGRQFAAISTSRTPGAGNRAARDYQHVSLHHPLSHRRRHGGDLARAAQRTASDQSVITPGGACGGLAESGFVRLLRPVPLGMAAGGLPFRLVTSIPLAAACAPVRLRFLALARFRPGSRHACAYVPRPIASAI